MAKYRKGDRVWVAGDVVADQLPNDSSVQVRVAGMSLAEARWFNHEAQVMLNFAHFEVGDTVTWNRDAENIGIVRAKIGAAESMQLWVETPRGMVTLMATSCECVPPNNSLLTAAARSALAYSRPGWTPWDGKEPPNLMGVWQGVTVMFKDRTEQRITEDFDWLADRGENPIIAYFDEIPF